MISLSQKIHSLNKRKKVITLSSSHDGETILVLNKVSNERTSIFTLSEVQAQAIIEANNTIIKDKTCKENILLPR